MVGRSQTSRIKKEGHRPLNLKRRRPYPHTKRETTTYRR
uniref:Uncharacterized protein n=1 Tax=Myoviridae sp. ctw4b6 TaxID=2825206 RepID=A0A8S5QCY1_9CAUD|nr:MAG TPA: hypothetical protein [Myoviridae sp. ctw4b6]